MLTLNWHDFRLKYVHLKNLSSLNTLTELEKENIWFPRYYTCMYVCMYVCNVNIILLTPVEFENI